MDVGIFYRNDDLRDWIPFDNELPNVEITELEINYARNEIHASSYGRGIWSSNLYGISCDVPLVINEVLQSQEFFIRGDLTSTSTLNVSSDITFTAANSITLSPGFFAANGSTLIGRIDPDVCSGDNFSRTSTKTGTFAGPLPGIIGVRSSDEIMLKNTNDLYIFPNPAVDDIYLRHEIRYEGNLSINLYDLTGRLIRHFDKGIRNSGNIVEKINIRSIPSGMYIVEVVSPGVKNSSKVVIADY